MKAINTLFVKRQERNRYKLKKLNKGKLPRLTVFKSNTHIYAQIIDDIQSHTLVASSTLDKSFKGKKSNNITASAEVGKLIALEAVKKKITKVIFDKGAYPYHGKIKALADSAREHGLTF